jgi:hypothetical protein
LGQLDRLPVEFMNTVTKTKKNIEKQIETPRLPEELENEIREIYELWTGYAQEYDGELNREIFEKILAGMHPRSSFNSISIISVSCLHIYMQHDTTSSMTQTH